MGSNWLALSSETKNENWPHFTWIEFEIRETPALMNCQSAQQSGDAHPLPSFLIFSSRQEFGVDVQSSREATVFANWDGSHSPSSRDMHSMHWCQLSFQMAVKHPQPTTDTASGSSWEELWAMSHPEEKASKITSCVQSFSSTTGVLFLLTGPFRIGMKLIYCYTGLKYLLFYYSCSWHKSVLPEEIRKGSRHWTRKDCTSLLEQVFGKVIGIPAQGVRHKARTQPIIPVLWIRRSLISYNGTENVSTVFCTNSAVSEQFWH